MAGSIELNHATCDAALASIAIKFQENSSTLNYRVF